MKFPVSFKMCPNPGCKGNTNTLAQGVIDDRIKAGFANKDTLGFTDIKRSALVDPKRASLSTPVLKTYYDICSKCGLVYCRVAQLVIMPSK